MHFRVFVSYFLLTFCCWKSLYFATVELYRCLVFTVDNCMCRVVDKAQPFCAVILHVSVIPRARPALFIGAQERRDKGQQWGQGYWGGAATPSPPGRGSRERCEPPPPSEFPGRAATAQMFFTIFSTQDCLS